MVKKNKLNLKKPAKLLQLGEKYITEQFLEQLAMGIKIEKEHTTNDKIAEKIARDHLKEIPDYYARLTDMEDKAKKANKLNLKKTADESNPDWSTTYTDKSDE